MTAIGRILELIKKDATLEFRNSAIVSAILLFCFCIVFLVVKSFDQVEGKYWAALLWILVLFASLNSMVKSFVGDGPNQRIFNFTLYAPLEVILAKILFNLVYGLTIFIITYAMMRFFLPTNLYFPSYFIVAVLLATIGISTIFSFVAMMTSGYEHNASVLMSVLALPLTLPILLTIIKITSDLQLTSNLGVVTENIKILLGIDLLLLGAVCILFKELWQS